MEAQYDFGEASVQASVTSAQRATPEELVALAAKIWGEVRNSGVLPNEEKENEALLARLQTEYKDFATSFPLVLRWMVQLRQFNKKALLAYLQKHATTRMNTREDFLRLQAEYVVLLHRHTHAHPDEAYVRRLRESLVDQLLREDKKFAEMQKQAEEETRRAEGLVDADRRERLYQYIMSERVRREMNAQ